jgi:hypothetical protein
MPKPMIVAAAAVSCVLALSACGLSEDEAADLSAKVAADMEAQEARNAVRETQDFDRIAQETVDGMDTSGLGALTE